MALEQEGSLGQIDISPTAVATIANQAIKQCYGVVGMAGKTGVEGLSDRLQRDQRRGIDITIDDDGIEVDVYVIVQYGVRIKVVAESIQNTVKFHLERALGVPVRAVNVYVQGLRRQQNGAV